MKTIKGLILLSTLLTINLIAKAQSTGHEEHDSSSQMSILDTLSGSKSDKEIVQVIVNADTIVRVDSSGKTFIDTTVINIGKIQIILRTTEDGNNEIVVESNAGEDNHVISIGSNSGDSINIYQYKGEHNDSDIPVQCDRKTLKNFKSRSMLLDLGINTLLFNNTLQMPVDYKGLNMNPGKSINVKLHLFRQRVNLINHHLNLMYGLSLDMHNYRFSDPYNLKPRMDSVSLKVLDNSVRKSKLSDVWIELPVLLNFESNPWDSDRSFRINVGAYAGYLLGAHTKVKMADKTKIKERDDFNMQKFRYGLTGQIGYGWFNVFADYALTDFFNPGEGPILTPFTVGITLIGF